MKDLSIRFISGVIGFILLFFIVNQGGILLSLSIYIISLVGLRELYNALHNIKIFPIKIIGYLGASLLFLSTITSSISLDFIISFITIGLFILIITKNDIDLPGVGLTLFGIFYIPFLLFHIYFLNNTKFIWLIFIIAFGTDTFAYLTGNLIGKRKLCPKLSPKKTVEGSVGGIVGSVILTIIYSLFLGIGPIWKLVLLSIIASMISQFGDLGASKIKRMAGIKDYGSIMPGHGGVLDRFDSIILCAPLIYYYVNYFLN